MHFNRLFIAALALGIGFGAAAEHYKVIIPFDADDNGAMVRLMDYDKWEPIDSTLVADQTAVFEGEIDEDILARLIVDGQRGPVFILESGTISFNRNGEAFGTMLNDQMRQFDKRLEDIYKASKDAPQADGQKFEELYYATVDSCLAANDDNALGYYAFLNGDLTQLSVEELEAYTTKYPTLTSKERIQKQLEASKKRLATMPGNKFTDFEITYDGSTKRLSDYVGKGRYTLVDFWASWCGPCMRQAAVLKDLYSKYHDQGLDIVGVAVWDKPEDTLRAIKSHELPWNNILDAGTIPTDLYGISGIPCIMLVAPDGTIVSRDKQGDELRADVEAAMSKIKN